MTPTWAGVMCVPSRWDGTSGPRSGSENAESDKRRWLEMRTLADQVLALYDDAQAA
jgi:hypothetical protein